MMSIWASRPHKTVVLLGAGASHGSDHHLPTMAGFFGSDIAALPEPLGKFLVRFYPHKDLKRFNLEEVLSYVYISESRVPAWTGRAALAVSWPRIAYEDLLGFVADRLRTSDDPCQYHVALFRRLQPEDSILTVNYDLVGDCALKDVERARDISRPRKVTDLIDGSRLRKMPELLGKPHFWGQLPALSPGEKETGFFLKLHGSLDWLHCPNRQCGNSARFYCLGIEDLPEGQVAGEPCRVCGTPLRLFLVPPIATKTIENEGRLAFLWNLALRQLVDAKRVVIVGVSFVPSDQELRWLVRESSALSALSNPEIHIVNPCAADRQNTRELFPVGARIEEFDTLEAYVAAGEPKQQPGPRTVAPSGPGV